MEDNNRSNTFSPGWTDTDNSTNFNLTQSDIDIYLDELSNQMALTLLPAMLVQGVVLFIGAVGNSLVLYIYCFKFNPSSTRTAILALACLDLLTCALSIPGEILDLRFSYNFRSQFLCKGLRTVTTAILMSSGLTLVTVALDRYKRICRPLQHQLSATDARTRVIMSCSVGTAFAVPASIVYGLALVPTNKKDVYGNECSTSETYARHPLRIAYNVALSTIFLAAFTTMIVIYIFIGRQVLKQNNFRNSMQQRKGSAGSNGVKRRNTMYNNEDEEPDHSNSDGAKESSFSKDPILEHEPLSIISDGGAFKLEDSKCNNTRLPRRASVLHRLKKLSPTGNARTSKTTWMLFFITLVFVISFLPHIMLKAVQAANKNFVDNLSTVGVIFYNIMVRSYFFNTAANAFVYGFCSPKFRQECQALISKLTFWVKTRKHSIQSDDLN